MTARASNVRLYVVAHDLMQHGRVYDLDRNRHLRNDYNADTIVMLSRRVYYEENYEIYENGNRTYVRENPRKWPRNQRNGARLW